MFPPRLHLANLPTPLVPLDRLSAKTGGPRIWLKRDDLTDTTASGNKLRKLEFSLGQALADSADLVITCGGTQSNHCRATATMAAQLGLRCHLLLRGREPETADGNLLLDQLLGAQITFLDAARYEQLAVEVDQLTESYARQGIRAYYIPVGASDEVGLWGYAEAANELKADFSRLDIDPVAVVSAAGSGGTLGGLIAGKALYNLKPEMLAYNVCDDADWFINKIEADLNKWQHRYQQPITIERQAINVTDGFVGPGYARAEPKVFSRIREVAQLEGVIFDPVYTGKAFDAMLTEIQAGRFDGASDIVFLHTGGLFGIFPQKSSFPLD
ncbi:MAG: D-cysteine desulfhydrase family protein [Pseudomonadales bacterium]|nr:D-cysteine desulfhydrase family protein [Pseudomonadales bacterium]